MIHCDNSLSVAWKPCSHALHTHAHADNMCDEPRLLCTCSLNNLVDTHGDDVYAIADVLQCVESLQHVVLNSSEDIELQVSVHSNTLLTGNCRN